MKTRSPHLRFFRLWLALGPGGLALTGTGFAAEEVESKPKLLSTKGGGGATWGSVAELEAAIKKGNPKAKLQLGELLLRGDSAAGVTADVGRALKLLDEAARAGEVAAAFRIGMTLLNDEVADADPVRAAAYLKAAAVGGREEAFRNLGVSYSNGRGVKRDYAEALAWLILSAKRDNSDTGAEELRKYLTKIRRTEVIAAGEKRAPVLERELAALKMEAVLPPPAPFAVHAAAGPLKMAAVSAGAGDDTPLPVAGAGAATAAGVKLIAPTGRLWQWPSVTALERDAAQGKADALAALGQVLLDGRLVSEDSTRAAEVLAKGAAAGSADAAQLLAELYTKGTRIQEDNTKAFAYTLQAAKGGVLTAAYNLGALYANGRGTPVNYPEALTWLTVAKHFKRDSGSLKQVRDYLQKTKPELVAPAEKRAAAHIAEIEKLRTDLPGL